MATVGEIIVRMSGDARPLFRTLDEARDGVDRFQAAAGAAGPPASAARGAAAAAAPDAARGPDQLGDSLHDALVVGMAPLSSFATRFEAQFNRVGGTIVTLARRIDSAIKAPGAAAALDKLQEKLRSGVAAAAAKASDQLSFVERATLRLGPAADRAVGAYRRFNSIRDFFGNFGDVAGKGLDKVAKINLDGPARSAGLISKGFSSIAQPVQAATVGVKALGFQIAASLGIVGLGFKAVTEGIQFVTGGIKDASHLNEVLSMTGVVFGDSAGKIVGEAEKMSAAFGTNKSEFIEATAGFGAGFKNSGKTKEEAAELGLQLTKLGMDIASAKDASNSEVFTALSAAMRGEFDPLERFHVALTANAVSAHALAMGLAKTKGEIDDNAKKMAILDLVSRQTGDYQGDLARTADQPANAFRKLSGQVQNLGISLGQSLLPAISRGTALLSRIASSALATFESLKQGVGGFAGGFMTAVETTLLPGFAAIGARLMELPSAISAAIGPGATGTISGFASAIKTFVLDAIDTVGFAWRNLPDLVDVAVLQMTEKVLNLGAVFSAWGTNVGLIGEWFANNWVQIVTDGVNRVATVFRNLGANISSLWAGIQSLMAGNGFQFEWTDLLKGVEATVGALPEMVDPVYTSLQDQIDSKMGAIADNEAKRARAMAQAAKGPDGVAPPPPGRVEEELKKAEKGEGYHATAAVSLGSKEFASAVTRHANGGAGDDSKPIKSVAKNTQDHLAEARTQTQIWRDIKDSLADVGRFNAASL